MAAIRFGSGLRHALDSVAEFWLGYEQAPLTRVREAGEWSPDDPSDYCHRCGESIGPHEATDSGCGECRNRKPLIDRFMRLGRYDGDLRDWILALKFHRRWEMGYSLGQSLGDAVLEAIGPLGTGRRLVIPMPMPWTRRLYRGVDHAAIIAEAVADRVRGTVVQPLVHRNGPPQVTLTASERRRSARSLLDRRSAAGLVGRLRVPPVRGAELILVDDVRTTGGTLDAAARLLRPQEPAGIVAAVLAVADGPGRTGRKADGDAPS